MGNSTCQFPLWGTETPTHLYCGHVKKDHSSYCKVHHDFCYDAVATARVRRSAVQNNTITLPSVSDYRPKTCGPILPNKKVVKRDKETLIVPDIIIEVD